MDISSVGQLVYIVEDESDLQWILSDVISSWGYRVKCFDNQYSAFKEIFVEPPHFLITDLTLQAGSGIDLIRDFRKINSQSPILLITGRELSDVFDRIKDYPLVKIIRKPFDIDMILNFLKSAS